MRFELRGVTEIVDALQRMANDAQRTAIDAATIAAREVQAELPNHIASRSFSAGREAYVTTFSVRPETNPPGAVLSTWAPYARVEEYGINKIVQVRQHQRQGHSVRAHSMMLQRAPKHVLGRSLAAARDRAVAGAFDVWRQAFAI